jgi:hypothetical protein
LLLELLTNCPLQVEQPKLLTVIQTHLNSKKTQNHARKRLSNKAKDIKHVNVVWKLQLRGIQVNLLNNLHQTNLAGSQFVVLTDRIPIFSQDSLHKISLLEL